MTRNDCYILRGNLEADLPICQQQNDELCDYQTKRGEKIFLISWLDPLLSAGQDLLCLPGRFFFHWICAWMTWMLGLNSTSFIWWRKVRKQEPHLQVKFSTSSGGDTRHLWGSNDRSPPQALVAFSSGCPDDRLGAGAESSAIPLGCACDEPQGLLEAEPLAILGRLASDQFLVFFYFQLLSDTYLRAVDTALNRMVSIQGRGRVMILGWRS